MEILRLGVTLKTLSPLHHGFTDPAEKGVGNDKKTLRLVRQVALLVPNDNGQWKRVVVPVLGGNALRGRMRRIAAAETFDILKVAPEDFVAHGRRAFHTLTSGGTLTKRDAQSHAWSNHPTYRRDRVAEWPLLSLFGFSFDDFMVGSKLRVHFGWPLISKIRPAIAIEGVDDALFPTGDWIDVTDYSEYLALEGTLASPSGLARAHFEYRHADDAMVPMPDAADDDTRDNERSAMVMGYQYVPAGIPFGIRLFGTDLTELEQSLLRLTLEATFPDQDLFLFGSRNTSGMGVFRVQRRSALDSLPDPDVYRQYLQDHRDRLVKQILDDHQFLHDKAALKAIPAELKKSAKVESAPADEGNDASQEAN